MKTNNEELTKKIKVTSIKIIVRIINGRPYYVIEFIKYLDNELYFGYGSYVLSNVIKWKEEYFEVVEVSSVTVKELASECERGHGCSSCTLKNICSKFYEDIKSMSVKRLVDITENNETLTINEQNNQEQSVLYENKCRQNNMSCSECQERYEMPYNFCCLDECNTLESCRDCISGINHKKIPYHIDYNINLIEGHAGTGKQMQIKKLVETYLSPSHKGHFCNNIFFITDDIDCCFTDVYLKRNCKLLIVKDIDTFLLKTVKCNLITNYSDIYPYSLFIIDHIKHVDIFEKYRATLETFSCNKLKMFGVHQLPNTYNNCNDK